MKNRELDEQLECMRRDLEESRTRSDRGDLTTQFLLLFKIPAAATRIIF